MDWITTRYYPLEEVVVGLATKLSSESVKSYPSLTFFKQDERMSRDWRRRSVVYHLRALRKWINTKPNMLLVFASSRHFNLFEATSNDKIVVLVGNESERLERQLILGTISAGVVSFLLHHGNSRNCPSALENCAFEVTSDRDHSISGDISSHTAVAVNLLDSQS